jgi:hypothetical protein
MSLTILYRHPDRPDEACMTMIAGQTDAAEIVDQLEKRGFVVEKITTRSFASAPAEPAETPRPMPDAGYFP